MFIFSSLKLAEMKKKIILGVTTCLITIITMFSFNMSQQSNRSDISLKDIAKMVSANAEEDLAPCISNGAGCYDNYLWWPCYKEKL